jgi:hypothetical protein
VATTATQQPQIQQQALYLRASSALEHLYNATDHNFDKVVDFLGTMAEAESFRVSRPQSHLIRLRNIPFPYSNGGGHNKAGVKRTYDAKGVLRTSSLKQQRKRLRAMMGNPVL